MLKNGLVKFPFINFIYKLKRKVNKAQNAEKCACQISFCKFSFIDYKRKVNKAQNAEKWACQISFYRL